MMRVLCIFFIALFFVSCKKNGIPKDVLPKEKMEAVLWDYISADMYAKNNLAADTANKMKDVAYRLQEKVFAKNNIDRSTFTKSYEWYQNHDDIFMVMLDSISAKQSRNLEKERNAGRKNAQ